MPATVEIEDIEEMRRLAGIDDVDLRAEIRGLKVGDFVNLTFTSAARSFAMVPVRITQIRGMAFRGRLSRRALSIPRAKIVAFTMSHVHSVVKRLNEHV